MSTQALTGGITLVDPLQHPSWDTLLSGRPGATVFHTAGWARVLQETYGHKPVYFCTENRGQVESILPVGEVTSWVSGTRGVSLPFTDFCAPLLVNQGDAPKLYQAAQNYGQSRQWRSLECRSPAQDLWPGAKAGAPFISHILDLEVGPDELLKRIDPAVRRALRKAQSAGLKVEFRQDEEALHTFFELHTLTRSRHGLPPQPLSFFQNIWRHLLSRGLGFVGLAQTQSAPIAATVFLHFGGHALYKFGASDLRFQSLRPNNLLMWESIKHCMEIGCRKLHFGRTSLANEGLRRFKLSFGAHEETLTYSKYDFRRHSFVRDQDRAEGWHNSVFRCLPLPLLRLAGRLLYPHLS